MFVSPPSCGAVCARPGDQRVERGESDNLKPDHSSLWWNPVVFSYLKVELNACLECQRFSENSTGSLQSVRQSGWCGLVMVRDHHLFQIWLQKYFFHTPHIKTLHRRQDFARLKQRHGQIFEDLSFLNSHFRNFHYHTVVTTHLIAPSITPDGNGRIVLMK